MSFNAAAVRAAIKDVLEANAGSVRTMYSGQMASGVFEGQSDQARHAKALIGTHRFDVRLGSLRAHEASPVAAIGSYALKRCDVFIDVTTKTATQVQLEDRDDVLAAVASDCEQAAQALSYPGNVAASSALVATGVVSGLLLGPGGEGSPVVDEPQQDWGKQEIKTRISASAVLRVQQHTLVDSEPLDIFGQLVRAWWRADNVTYYGGVGGTSLQTWDDSSGNGRAISDDGASIFPLQRAIGYTVGGQSAITSFASDSRAIASGALIPGGNDSRPNVYIVGKYNGVVPLPTEHMAYAIDANADVVFACYRNVGGNLVFQVGAGTTTGPAVSTGVDALLECLLDDDGNTHVRINNSTVSTAAATINANAVASFGVPGTAAVSSAQFSYAEVIVLNGYPSAAQQSAYRAYVASKYGLTLT